MCPYCNNNRPFPFNPMFPPGGPFGPGGPGPGQGGPGAMQPPGPPPAITPQKPQGVAMFVDPGAIYACIYKFIYIWPSFGVPFWAWLTFVGPNSIAGFRWTGFNWVYFTMDLKYVDYSECY